MLGWSQSGDGKDNGGRNVASWVRGDDSQQVEDCGVGELVERGELTRLRKRGKKQKKVENNILQPLIIDPTVFPINWKLS